ncbi:SRPBCC family protein [Pedobacter sp. P351]|uniref:SRPBCC family protein n=1 Tax=Pedobacter superstes TaxID=3133441 RepID=UPI00309BEC8B
MKALKIILLVIVFLAAFFFIGGMLLPKTYQVKRSISINAPDSVVYNNIADFNNFLKWNPWYKMEPSARIKIAGTAGQPGHLYTWEGEETGTGQMLIKNIVPQKLVDIELKFIKPFENTAKTKFQLDAKENTTVVTWIMEGENKSSMDRWMGLGMDSMIGGDFESGLKELKSLSEK